MNYRKPPALATWMLDHLRSRGSNEALSGDLLEAFCTGRSAGWYWYQVIAAIAIAWGRNLWRHRITLFFAAVWSVGKQVQMGEFTSFLDPFRGDMPEEVSF